MKQVIISMSVLFISFASLAQVDSSRVEQYCQLIVTPRLLSNKVTIELDFGEHRSYWSDNRIRAYNGKLKVFNTVVDALNFMGREGWYFINAYPVKTGELEVYHFAFRKLVPKTEL